MTKESNEKKLKWKPVLSIFCILASLFFISSSFNPKNGKILLGAITASLAFFAGVFPDHYSYVKSLWFDKILPATHSFFIWLCAIIIFVLAIMTLKNYKLSLKIEKKPI